MVEAAFTTPAGTSNPLPFFYSPPPTVLDVSPASGPTAGGSTITITGRNLAPAHALGTVTIAVTTTGGATTAPGVFLYLL